RGATLAVAGEAAPVPLACLWPNHVRTPTLPPGGVVTHLIYGGHARPADFNGRKVEGAVVLLDFDCQTDWLNAFLLGARAVIFVEPLEPLRPEAEAKFLTVPADAPRFWVGRQQGLRLRRLAEEATAPVAVTLKARMDWVNAETANIIGTLPAALDSTADGVIVISASYDSMSVVPALAPGAEQACSLAALLEIARTLKTHPLRRKVVFVATGAHSQALAGARHFIRSHILPSDDGAKPLDVAAYISLDLASHSRRVGLFYKGSFIDQEERRIQPWLSHLGKTWMSWAGKTCDALGVPVESAALDCINTLHNRSWRNYLPTPMAFESELATLAGLVGLTFATADDARLAVDTPLDTPSRVDLGNLLAQVRLLCCVLPNLLNTDGPFIRTPLNRYWTRIEARAVEFDFKKDYLPNEPLEGALVLVQEPAPKKSLGGVRGEPIVMADADGRVSLDGVADVRAVHWRARMTCTAFCVNPDTGHVTYAPDLGAEGAKNYPIETVMNAAVKNITVVCFPCRSLDIYDLADQRYYIPFDTINVLDAGTNSSPMNFGYLLPRNPPWLSSTETSSVVFAKPGTRLRVLMGAGMVGKRLLLLNATRTKPLGTGFLVGEQGSTVPLTPLQAASDMWYLDHSRVTTFEKHGLENPRVRRLHNSAEALLVQARKALKEYDYATFLSRARAAWALEARIYPEVVGMANDVVKGLVFYLVLVLPFAFFVERLLINARTITRRILGTAGIFLLVFGLLAIFHPAFRVSISPLMVLLAFIVLTLSILVITILVQRFEQLMEERRAMASGVHAADVSRMSAALTAFLLGIGNLRKRPIRTALTATTLVLLTFSVLSLTAVVQYLKQTTIPYPGVLARYDGLLLRGRQWQPLNDIAYDVLANEFGTGAVVPRAWYFSATVGDVSQIALTGGPDNRTVYAGALVGLTSIEQHLTGLGETLLAGRWLKDTADEVLLPQELAKALGLEPQDAIGKPVTCFGRKLTVVGVFDSHKLVQLTDLDGEPITPVDYRQMNLRRRTEGPPDPDEIEEYIHMVANTVPIIPYDLAIAIGGNLRSLVLRAASKDEVSKLLHDLMPRTELTLFAGRDGQTDLFSTRGASSITGAGSLFVPSLLAALIVFNTMLGSIYERTREIAIFTSVGLAPKHVGALFLAESIVHAVIGVVVGYLLGQAISLVIHSYGLLPGLQLNYSSSATMLLSIFVMAVVIGSSIYPALKAKQLAVPGVEARWQLPDAVGDVMTIELPFTVGRETALGTNAYIEEFCQAHTEAALGGFAAADVLLQRLDAADATGLRISMTAWLAPFDVGVSQHVELETSLLPDGMFYGIVLRLTRRAGDQSSWRRLNRHFSDRIRKQFLIWRILTPEMRQVYADRTTRRFGEAALCAPTAPEATVEDTA
ncbi:M28 family peptidase, partial [bacterium]|nr:M28 family peptidase [bacterium]